jgi:hypothetical protein
MPGFYRGATKPGSGKFAVQRVSRETRLNVGGAGLFHVKRPWNKEMNK